MGNDEYTELLCAMKDLWQDHLLLRKQHLELACKYDGLVKIILDDNPLSIPALRLRLEIEAVKNSEEIKEKFKQLEESIKTIENLSSDSSLEIDKSILEGDIL